MTSEHKGATLVPAVDRAVLILQTLATHSTPLGVSDLSRELGLNKSTTHNILNTLCHHRLIERDDQAKTYRLGTALANLGHCVSERIDLRTVAHARLVALAHAVEETVILGTFHDGHITIIDQEEAPHDVKITAPLGRRLYYSVAAFGKIFLAAMPSDEVSKLIGAKSLREFTSKSITKISAYRAALTQVREQGYAVDDEEYLDGVRAISAPINDAQGSVVAALCVVGFSARLANGKLTGLAKQTRQTAEEISRQLGAVEYPQWNGVG